MVDPLVLSLVTFLTLFIGCWAAFVALMTGRVMIESRRKRGVCRKSDIHILAWTSILTVSFLVVVFVWPGLIKMIPSTVAFVEIASIPFLLYLSESVVKNFKRLGKIQVDRTVIN